jgi:DNA-directed RNA polymerase subunit N (RpoN/RPB10)
MRLKAINFRNIIKLIYRLRYIYIVYIMIIPVKCFTCGKVLGDKYRFYVREVRKVKSSNDDYSKVTYLTQSNTEKTAEGKILDRMGLNKICCRRHMLTHVDIE